MNILLKKYVPILLNTNLKVYTLLNWVNFFLFIDLGLSRTTNSVQVFAPQGTVLTSPVKAFLGKRLKAEWLLGVSQEIEKDSTEGATFIDLNFCISASRAS